MRLSAIAQRSAAVGRSPAHHDLVVGGALPRGFRLFGLLLDGDRGAAGEEREDEASFSQPVDVASCQSRLEIPSKRYAVAMQKATVTETQNATARAAGTITSEAWAAMASAGAIVMKSAEAMKSQRRR